MRWPSQHIRRLKSREGTTDGCVGRVQRIPGLSTLDEHEAGMTAEETKEILMMVAAVADAEGLDPQSLKEAKTRPDWPRWLHVIRTEIKNLKQAGTWEVMRQPKDSNVVGSKWVLRIKKDEHGEIERYKVQLVAKGYTQVYSEDYYETFAPIAQLAAI